MTAPARQCITGCTLRPGHDHTCLPNPRPVTRCVVCAGRGSEPVDGFTCVHCCGTGLAL